VLAMHSHIATRSSLDERGRKAAVQQRVHVEGEVRRKGPPAPDEVCTSTGPVQNCPVTL